jgi:hypothetical protein
VHLTGTFTFQYTFITVDDRIMSEGIAVYNLTGAGDKTGTKYEGKGTLKSHDLDVWNAEGGYYQVQNSNTLQRITLITPGTNNNLVFIHNFKVVADANFNLILFTEKFVYDACQ